MGGSPRAVFQSSAACNFNSWEKSLVSREWLHAGREPFEKAWGWTKRPPCQHCLPFPLVFILEKSSKLGPCWWVYICGETVLLKSCCLGLSGDILEAVGKCGRICVLCAHESLFIIFAQRARNWMRNSATCLLWTALGWDYCWREKTGVRLFKTDVRRRDWSGSPLFHFFIPYKYRTDYEKNGTTPNRAKKIKDNVYSQISHLLRPSFTCSTLYSHLFRSEVFSYFS
jgi:hypothetical protein